MSSSGNESKKQDVQSNILTRHGARQAKIQTRAMTANVKPSAAVLAAKKKAQQKKKQTFDSHIKDYYQTAIESRTKVKGPTGFVTDPRMEDHKCLWDGNHPECPERLTSIINRCRELNLLEQCKILPSRMATKDEILSLHSPLVYEMLDATRNNHDVQFLEELSSKFDAIYFHPSTQELALLAAGSTIDLVERIISGQVQNGMAAVRPPGHHAMHAEPCGYCFYNNVALAALHALNEGIQRILIVDWDVHHGQATQQMFYDDPRVVYFSIHRYEHGAFWPNLRQSNFDYVGAGRGKGYNFNVPLNKTGMTDADYLAIWDQLLLPMAFEFSPQLIVVSAGYDAAVGDEKGEMQLSPACYASLVHLLMCVCPSVCVVLEGGYFPPSLAEGAALTLRTLIGHPPPALTQLTEPTDSIRESILNCIYAHKKYWSCFNYQPVYSLDTSVPNVCDGAKEKHTVVLRWEGDETRPDRFDTRDCYPMQDEQIKRKFMEKLDELRSVTNLKVAEHEVGYVYDERMLKHHNVFEPGHVECPERILRIHERLRDFGLLDRMLRVPARLATDEEILSVHTKDHLDRLKSLATTKLRDLKSHKEKFDSVYFHPESFESASVAVGSVLQMVDAVLNGQCQSGVCLVRPPGHHADAAEPCGFCLCNAVGAAAKRAARKGKVLLFDWDVHHGNGTQKITYEDDRILYISIHRYDNGSFFPQSKDADYTMVGEGRGEGFNINIPWNKRGMSDAEYLAACTQVVLPVAREFAPDLVLVSAGFDACVADPLGGCKVTPECFGRMTNLLKSLAGGRVILCLEGGYNVTSISYAMTMCTKALLGDPISHHYEPKTTCHPSATETINNVIKTHKKYWKCLKFQLALPSENVLGEPAPSRGFFGKEDGNISWNSGILSELSLSNVSSNSKDSTQTDISLEIRMSNLSINRSAGDKFNHSAHGKCTDGVHCGTDDEEDNIQSDRNISSVPENPDFTGKNQNVASRCSNSINPNPNMSSETIKPSEDTNRSACVSSDKAVDKGTNDASSSKRGISSEKAEQKQTLVDYLAQNMQALVDEEMFAVIPLPWCPHLETLYAIPEDVSFEQGLKCVECDETNENWICLHCYVRACARGVHGHMQAHHAATAHALVLSLLDLSVWCCACDAYVDNALLYDARNRAHRTKFGSDMPWCYPDTLRMG